MNDLHQAPPSTPAGPPAVSGRIPEDEAKREKKRRLSGLQFQFQIALGAIFLVFCALTAWLIYIHQKHLIEQTALSKSHMVMAAVESTRAYIRETLRPKMYEFTGPDTFLLEAMSTSYITREVMERFKQTLPEYSYRRVAVNARNPQSAPTPIEMELIEYFRSHPGKADWQGMRSFGDSVAFVHARPVVMRRSCLKCHGRPGDAPAPLVSLYGATRGFEHTEGELAGVMAVSIPVEIALRKSRSQALSVFWVTLLLISFLYILISFLFNRMVVRSLRGLLDIFRHGLADDPDDPALREMSSKVEIDELTDAARDMTCHLQSARERLRQYASDLEQRVEARTRDLQTSRQQLREKVSARNRELGTLNKIAELITRSFHLGDILPGVLEETLGLIPAKGAAIYLLSGAEDHRRLKIECHRNADKLAAVISGQARKDSAPPANLAQAIWAAAQGETTLFACLQNHNCLNVPLVCRDRILGVMTFVGADFDDTSLELKALLMSIGQQIGITVESLQNISALLQSNELLQSVFDGIPDIMVLLDRGLKIRMVNKAYLKRHSVSIDAILGHTCGALDGSCQCSLAGQELRTAMAQRRQTQEVVRTPEGEIFRVYYYPILDESGQVWGILRYAKDITLETQVEQRIQQTEKLAALGQLAAGVAHEINNPIGVVLCYTKLLRGQLDRADQAIDDVKVIEKQALNCQRIVSDLLNFARGRRSEPAPTDVNAAVREVTEMVYLQFHKNGTEVITDLQPDIPRLHLDADRIKQVFLNLLMNAYQAIDPPGGRIRVSTRYRPAEGCVDIAFIDNGSGIPAAVVDRIFDPFFSTKTTGEGTGLGLSVSYGIVKDH